MRSHLVVLLFVALWLTAMSWSTTGITSLTGSWSLDQSNGSGSLQIQQDGTNLGGIATFPGMATGQIRGSVEGRKVRFVVTWRSTLHGVYEATISPDGQQMLNGTTRPQEGGGSAAFTATRSRGASLVGTWSLDQSNGSGRIRLEQQGTALSGTATFPGMAPGPKIGLRWVKCFVITWRSNLHGVYEATLSPDGQQMIQGTTRPQEGGGSATFSATRIR